MLVAVLGSVLSPTRAIAEYLKSKRDTALFIRRWNFGFLIASVIACFVVYILDIFSFPCQPLWFLAAISFSRSNEVFYAFLSDSLDRIRGQQPRIIPLVSADRVVLAGRSYLETTLNFALIYYLLFADGFDRAFRDIFEAVYFSGVTITTLGYGDITPQGLLPQLLVIYEVFIGFVLIIVAFSAYLGGQRREAT